MRRTAVWISRDEMVDFLLYDASFEASEAMRSKISLTNELKRIHEFMCVTLDVNGEKDTLENHHCLVGDTGIRVDLLQDLVDVGGVGLLTLLLPLLLITVTGNRRLFSSFGGLATGRF